MGGGEGGIGRAFACAHVRVIYIRHAQDPPQLYIYIVDIYIEYPSGRLLICAVDELNVGQVLANSLSHLQQTGVSMVVTREYIQVTCKHFTTRDTNLVPQGWPNHDVSSLRVDGGKV
jgi:hypothetical protein